MQIMSSDWYVLNALYIKLLFVMDMVGLKIEYDSRVDHMRCDKIPNKIYSEAKNIDYY